MDSALKLLHTCPIFLPILQHQPGQSLDLVQHSTGHLMHLPPQVNSHIAFLLLVLIPLHPIFLLLLLQHGIQLLMIAMELVFEFLCYVSMHVVQLVQHFLS